MIVVKDFKERVFSSKEELHLALQANKNVLIDMKKSIVKHSDGSLFSLKSESEETTKAIKLETGFFYSVINTTLYLDSHNDVHINNIWNKSVKEQQGSIYYLADHERSVDKVIAHPQDVEMSIKTISWKELGAKYEGETQGLIFKIPSNKIRLESAKQIVNENIPIQNSVCMQYVKMLLCVDSKNPDFLEEKANFDKYYPMIVNKESVEGTGYFWAILEAKIYREGSMVIDGSNPITPILQNVEADKNITSINTPEPLKNTRKNINNILLTN